MTATPADDTATWLALPGEENLVSVVIPTFNRLPFVQELLAALIAQSWRPLQIIVVDDGSTDGSAEWLASWRPGLPGISHEIIQRSNGGPASARNLGCTVARGRFIYFIDSDDLPAPDAISALVTPLLGSDAALSLGQIEEVDMAGKRIAHVRPAWNPKHLRLNSWLTHAALYRRTTLHDAGPFNEDLRLGEDTELHWRICASSSSVQIVDRIVGLRRRHGSDHLSLNIPVTSHVEAQFRAVASFWNWARVEQRDSDGIKHFVRTELLDVATKLGSGGRFAAKNEAIAVAIAVGRLSPLARSITVALFSPNQRLYYAVLAFASRAGRVLRHPSRLKRLWQPPSEYTRP
ncbi:glycosyltransferase family 2 protein [Novosphingobium sp. PASSN1]|uniref:glycosyltransferase family 2 protein n=1 Tax=Novosphingobium sp. PASSN1 TaxID=2015561 RepID=UPI0025EF999E|nr:glycosyltransferase family 2 protein [Novosphingobium sp. PASSN1]